MKCRYFYYIVEDKKDKKSGIYVSKDKADVINDFIDQRMLVTFITELTEEEYYKIKRYEKLHSR